MVRDVRVVTLDLERRERVVEVNLGKKYMVGEVDGSVGDALLLSGEI